MGIAGAELPTVGPSHVFQRQAKLSGHARLAQAQPGIGLNVHHPARVSDGQIEIRPDLALQIGGRPVHHGCGGCRGHTAGAVHGTIDR